MKTYKEDWTIAGMLIYYTIDAMIEALFREAKKKVTAKLTSRSSRNSLLVPLLPKGGDIEFFSYFNPF